MNHKNPLIGKTCKKGYEIQILHSGAGYYIGTVCEDGPMCRISSKYAKTREQAEYLACDRIAAEIGFCNGGLGCLCNERVCPICGRIYDEEPAISRRDNVTEICPECGQAEALEDFFGGK